MTTVIEQMRTDIKVAMKAGDAIKRDTLRTVVGGVENAEKASKKGSVTFDDKQVIAFIQKEIRNRHEAAGLFAQGGEQERVNREETEAGILSEYVPSPLTEDEARAIVKRVFESKKSMITSPKNMGMVMKDVTPEIDGRFDGKAVSQMVREMVAEHLSS